MMRGWDQYANAADVALNGDGRDNDRYFACRQRIIDHNVDNICSLMPGLKQLNLQSEFKGFVPNLHIIDPISYTMTLAETVECMNWGDIKTLQTRLDARYGVKLRKIHYDSSHSEDARAEDAQSKVPEPKDLQFDYLQPKDDKNEERLNKLHHHGVFNPDFEVQCYIASWPFFDVPPSYCKTVMSSHSHSGGGEGRGNKNQETANPLLGLSLDELLERGDLHDGNNLDEVFKRALFASKTSN